tara:strand:- start:15735 stop:15995 length:261 start_codon:yes stop_codon:yes gene_type:complete
MSNYTFDEGVPIPPVSTGGRSATYKSKYAFISMLNPNQSVFIPMSRHKSVNLSQATARLGKKMDRKFVLRKRVENSIVGTRIWRTS